MAWYIRLSWTKANSGYSGDGFRIYCQVNADPESLVASVPITQTTYDYPVSPGNMYKFRVTEYKNQFIQGTTYVYESPAATITVTVPGNPQYSYAIPASTTAASVYIRPGVYTKSLRVQKKVSGSWQDYAIVTNLIPTSQLQSWTTWTHWGNTAYWQSCAEASESSYGAAFKGLGSLDRGYAFIYHYGTYPIAVTSGKRYVLCIALKADPASYVAVGGYLKGQSGTAYWAPSYSYAYLTPDSWRFFTFFVTPTASENCGWGFYIAAPRLYATYIYATAPFVGEAPPNDSITIPCVREYRVRAEDGNYYSDWISFGQQYIYRKVRLSWAEGNTSQQGESFVIERKVGGGSWEYLATVPITSATYDDEVYPPQTTLYYRVYEQFASRLSPASSEVSITIPSPWDPVANKPQNLQAFVIP